MTDEGKLVLDTLEAMLCKAEEKQRNLQDTLYSFDDKVKTAHNDLASVVRQCSIASDAATAAGLEAEALAEAVSAYRSMQGTKWVDDGFHNPPPEQPRDKAGDRFTPKVAEERTAHQIDAYLTDEQRHKMGLSV